jgi:hypothetical protein
MKPPEVEHQRSDILKLTFRVSHEMLMYMPILPEKGPRESFVESYFRLPYRVTDQNGKHWSVIRWLDSQWSREGTILDPLDMTEVVHLLGEAVLYDFWPGGLYPMPCETKPTLKPAYVGMFSDKS